MMPFSRTLRVVLLWAYLIAASLGSGPRRNSRALGQGLAWGLACFFCGDLPEYAQEDAMTTTITVSSHIYERLRQQAVATRSTPEQVAEAILRLQLDNSVHIEQRLTALGTQAYLRGGRVAVRHVAAFVQAGYSAEEIAATALPDVPAAAIYEAIAYYYDHREEIDAEQAANEPAAVQAQFRELLTPEQVVRLTRQPA